jgi:hypothetical protein
MEYKLLFAHDSVNMNLTWLYIYFRKDSSSALFNYFIFLLLMPISLGSYLYKVMGVPLQGPYINIIWIFHLDKICSYILKY